MQIRRMAPPSPGRIQACMRWSLDSRRGKFAGTKTLPCLVVTSIDPSMDPGIDPGMDPGIDPGIEPGIEPDIDPGIDPVIDPGTDATSCCAPCRVAGPPSMLAMAG
jgi:hypothetical protein